MKTAIVALLALGLTACASTKSGGGMSRLERYEAKQRAQQKQGVSLAELDAHAAQQGASLEGCYESTEDDKEGPGGKVKLTVGINAEGRVVSADAYTETLPELMIACMVDAVTQWPPFPARGEGALTVRKDFEFVLEPQGEGKAAAKFLGSR